MCLLIETKFLLPWKYTCYSCLNQKTRENSKNVSPFRGIASVASSLDGPWTGWICSEPVQMSRCCLSGVLSWWYDGLLRGLVVLHWLFVSREQSHCAFSGSASYVLAYWGSAAPLLSLQSFYNYARGHCEAMQNFFKVVHSGVLISVKQ